MGRTVPVGNRPGTASEKLFDDSRGARLKEPVGGQESSADHAGKLSVNCQTTVLYRYVGLGRPGIRHFRFAIEAETPNDAAVSGRMVSTAF